MSDPTLPAASSAARALIVRSVAAHWPEFARRHPALAAELSQEDYVAAALDALRQQPAYRAAIRRGELAAAVADWGARAADTAVRNVMRLASG